jgi:hypothetical protein
MQTGGVIWHLVANPFWTRPYIVENCFGRWVGDTVNACALMFTDRHKIGCG